MEYRQGHSRQSLPQIEPLRHCLSLSLHRRIVSSPQSHFAAILVICRAVRHRVRPADRHKFRVAGDEAFTWLRRRTGIMTRILPCSVWIVVLRNEDVVHMALCTFCRNGPDRYAVDPVASVLLMRWLCVSTNYLCRKSVRLCVRDSRWAVLLTRISSPLDCALNSTMHYASTIVR